MMGDQVDRSSIISDRAPRGSTLDVSGSLYDPYVIPVKSPYREFDHGPCVDLPGASHQPPGRPGSSPSKVDSLKGGCFILGFLNYPPFYDLRLIKGEPRVGASIKWGGWGARADSSQVQEGNLAWSL